MAAEIAGSPQNRSDILGWRREPLLARRANLRSPRAPTAAWTQSGAQPLLIQGPIWGEQTSSRGRLCGNRPEVGALCGSPLWTARACGQSSDWLSPRVVLRTGNAGDRCLECPGVGRQRDPCGGGLSHARGLCPYADRRDARAGGLGGAGRRAVNLARRAAASRCASSCSRPGTVAPTTCCSSTASRSACSRRRRRARRSPASSGSATSTSTGCRTTSTRRSRAAAVRLQVDRRRDAVHEQARPRRASRDVFAFHRPETLADWAARLLRRAPGADAAPPAAAPPGAGHDGAVAGAGRGDPQPRGVAGARTGRAR